MVDKAQINGPDGQPLSTATITGHGGSRMPSAAQLEAELGRALDQPDAVLNRIIGAVASIRQASDAAGQQGVESVKKLRALADEIESEVHMRLTEIIQEGHAFWEKMERSLVGFK